MLKPPSRIDCIRDDIEFIVRLLSDVDPVTGQVQLDAITFSELYELFQGLNDDDAVPPSRSHVYAIWEKFLQDSTIHIRDMKTVSKCDTCINLRMRIRKVS